MLAVSEGRREILAREKQADYEHWALAQLADVRVAPLRVMTQDLRHFGRITPDSWNRFDNEKYSRVAEDMTRTHHERPDFYAFDAETGDIVVTETDGLKPRYTLRNVYENGLRMSLEFADGDPRFDFQVRRDQIFLQTYEQVEAMMKGETDYDTIVMVSTFPMELLATDPEALKQKRYDLVDGKQFEYVFQRIDLDNGERMLGMGASTLHTPQEDLQLHTTHGREALAAVQQAHGVNVPVAMVSSHEQNGFIAKFNAGGQQVEAIMRADAAVYDAALQARTGLEYNHGRTDRTIDVYTLFKHCEADWVAYRAYHEMLANHAAGQALHPQLRDHLTNLLDDYLRLGKFNDTVGPEGMRRLFEQVWFGNITADMLLASNEVLDYAHSALMEKYIEDYKKTGRLPAMDGNRDVLGAYSADSGDANSGAISEGRSFNGCEVGNGVSDMSAAMALTEQNPGMTLEQALQQVAKSRSIAYNASLAEKYGSEHVRLGQCGACGGLGEIGPCGPGFCNPCDTRDRVERGYILRQYQKRQAQNSKRTAATPEAIVEPKPVATKQLRRRQRLTIGGMEEIIIATIADDEDVL